MIDESGSPVEHADADSPDLEQAGLEQADHEQAGPEPADQHAAESLRTGNPAVDGVLTSLDGLDDAPVDEHVAVFERAHEQLRSALDGPRDS